MSIILSGHIPVEVLNNIAEFSDPKSVMSLMQTNKENRKSMEKAGFGQYIPI
jgi:hypothetical protein